MEWRRRVCLVPQAASLVPGTVRDNLLFPWTLKVNAGSPKPDDDVLNEILSLAMLDGVTLDHAAAQLSGDVYKRQAYARVIEVLEMYAKLDVPAPSLSVTLSEKTIDDLPHMIELVRKYRVRGFGYNVLLSKGDEEKSDSYYRKASQFIIDSFVALRGDGVYEDRIMRKLNAFASARIHFSDCGATSGGQILFAPDGRIGICQGLMAEGENYVADRCV